MLHIDDLHHQEDGCEVDEYGRFKTMEGRKEGRKEGRFIYCQVAVVAYPPSVENDRHLTKKLGRQDSEGCTYSRSPELCYVPGGRSVSVETDRGHNQAASCASDSDTPMRSTLPVAVRYNPKDPTCASTRSWDAATRAGSASSLEDASLRTSGARSSLRDVPRAFARRRQSSHDLHMVVQEKDGQWADQPDWYRHNAQWRGFIPLRHTFGDFWRGAWARQTKTCMPVDVGTNGRWTLAENSRFAAASYLTKKTGAPAIFDVEHIHDSFTSGKAAHRFVARVNILRPVAPDRPTRLSVGAVVNIFTGIREADQSKKPPLPSPRKHLVQFDRKTCDCSISHRCHTRQVETVFSRLKAVCAAINSLSAGNTVGNTCKDPGKPTVFGATRGGDACLRWKSV
ncbi:hypothetical protein C8R46DRAFT_1030711 [Mycena filopes]|nr:hypothetical protein C8R46DRAFT_1030711 [Mycena filopes]